MSCDHKFSREKQKLYIPVCCKCGAAEYFIVKADLEQELEDVKDLVKRQNAGWGEDKAELHYLREAAQAVVDSEGVVYPIPASHSYKVATLKVALEVDTGS